jgi:hypothetical protein
VPRIQSSQSTPRALTNQPSAQRPATAQAKTTGKAAVTQAWGTKPSKVPEVATAARGLVDAYREASKATNQQAIVAGSQRVNDAADLLLKRTMTELASQHELRGNTDKADAVLQDLEKFMSKVGPSQPYRLDPERGTMGSLEDNDERLDKVMAKLASASEQLGKVNKKPAAENQQAFNRHAGGEAIRQEARFALAFQKAYLRDDKVLRQADTFFKALPKKVEGQVESRGGSLEALERFSATSEALAEMTKKLGGE